MHYYWGPAQLYEFMCTTIGVQPSSVSSCTRPAQLCEFMYTTIGVQLCEFMCTTIGVQLCEFTCTTIGAMYVFQVLGSGHYCLPDKSDTAFAPVTKRTADHFMTFLNPHDHTTSAVGDSWAEPTTPSSLSGERCVCVCVWMEPMLSPHLSLVRGVCVCVFGWSLCFPLISVW